MGRAVARAEGYVHSSTRMESPALQNVVKHREILYEFIPRLLYPVYYYL